MWKTFLETSEFTNWVSAHLSDDDLVGLQKELLNDPEKGDVMPGCGGLRKLRIADPKRGKGKRGGARVIYLHHEEQDIIHLITIYGKNQQDDLSPSDKKTYRQLVSVLKQRA